MEENYKDQEEIYSKRIRAGKRTYFFDVRSTRGGDYFLTITESKREGMDGPYVKKKIFLYKEDFEKFTEGLQDAIGFVQDHQSGEEPGSRPPLPSTPDLDFEV